MQRWTLILLVIFGFLYKSQVVAQPKIILATDDWEPYISKANVGHGKFAEIVTAVFKEMGMETDYIFAPWRRVEAIVKNGDAFAGIPYSYTQERYKTFNYSKPIMNSSYVFFYNKKVYPNGIRYNTLADLTPYRINGVAGYWYEALFKKANLNIDYVTSDEQGIAKLYFNRVDLAATDELVGWALIKKLYPTEVAQFAVLNKPFATQYLHLMVSRNYPNSAALTQKFNATLDRLRETGVVPSLQQSMP